MSDADYQLVLETLANASGEGGSLIAALRDLRGISEDELSGLARVSVQRLRGEEVGRSKLTDAEVNAIAAVLGVAPDMLIG